MPSASPLQKLAENLLDGSLADFIGERRREGFSWEHISRDLWTATSGEITASHVTVKKWARRLGIEDEPKAEVA